MMVLEVKKEIRTHYRIQDEEGNNYKLVIRFEEGFEVTGGERVKKTLRNSEGKKISPPQYSKIYNTIEEAVNNYINKYGN